MTTGTKVFLAVFAGFVGILVLYYGVMMPDSSSAPDLRPVPRDTSASTATDQQQSQTTTSDSQPSLPQPLWSLASSSANLVEGAAASSPNTSGPIPADALAFDPNIPTGSDSTQHNIVSQPIANHAISLPATTEVVTPVPGSTRPAVSSSPTPTPGTAPAPRSTTEYIVKSGDTMTSIAEAWFGDRNKWSLIARENPLEDPHRLRVGQKLRLPPKDATAAASSRTTTSTEPRTSSTGGGSTYVVRSGDTLAKIAREQYKDVAKWELIYEANRSVIGNDPSQLQVGMKLKLPPKT